ncbi:MAG: aldo/keto reductase [Erysipelotrichales bacterium]
MDSIKNGWTLSNGTKIPYMGLGTWKSEDVYESVRYALENGYYHIDTAHDYQNEAIIGKAIKDSKINRDDLFVCTKLWNDFGTYDETIAAFNESLEKLGLDYIDLYLIHWPRPIKYQNSWQRRNSQVWQAMEDLYLEGKIKAIGVSNFLVEHLDALSKNARIKPMVNQLRLCPGVVQEDVVAFCNSNDIILEAYSPFSRGLVFGIKELEKIAHKHQKTIAQVVLRWCYQKGFVALPKSITPKRIMDNKDIFDFNLTKEEVNIISNVDDLDTWDDPNNIDF